MSDEFRLVLCLFGGMAILVAIGVCGTIWRAQQRRRQMSRAAGELGYSYEPFGESLLREGIAGVPLFSLTALGVKSRLANVLRGKVLGIQFVLCDFHYATGAGGSRRRDYRQTVACFPLEKRLPDFALHPEPSSLERTFLKAFLKPLLSIESLAPTPDPRRRAVATLTSMFDDEGVTFEMHPDFSSRYRLVGSDRAAVRSLFRPDIIDFLESQDGRWISIESSGPWLVVFRHDIQVHPRQVQAFLQEAAQTAKLLL